jgi:hypothetical protein
MRQAAALGRPFDFPEKPLCSAAIFVLEPLKKAVKHFDELDQSIDRDSRWLSNLL